MDSDPLPPLRSVPPTALADLDIPAPRIKTDADVEAWRTTRGYHDLGLFLRRLSHSLVAHFLPYSPPTHCEPIAALLALLDTLDRWIDDIPPLDSPQRFGNLAFRTWGARLEQRAPTLLATLLPPALHPAAPHLSPHLLAAFGSFTRMDYGTGHEAAFALFLLSLSLLRFLPSSPADDRALVLAVFVRYLRLCWRLQDTYRLEPAGSHGVWGLDDSCFLPYIFGSAQLLDQTHTPPSSMLHPPLPQTTLYALAITRIHAVKRGPFHEHSSQLHAIAASVPSWAKVHSGLFKMYEAEVLGKRVVVQHLPLGGLLEWAPQPLPQPLPRSTAPSVVPETPKPKHSRGRGTMGPPPPPSPQQLPHDQAGGADNLG